MKKISVPVLMAVLLLFNCGKKSEPAPTPLDFLTTKTWEPVALKVSITLEPEFIVALLPEPFKTIFDNLKMQDLLTNQEACAKDNRYQFKTNGKYLILDEQDKCPNHQAEERDYKLSPDFKLFTISPPALTGSGIPPQLPFDINAVFTDMTVVELTAQRFQFKKTTTQKLENLTIPGLPIQVPLSLNIDVDFSFKK